MGTFVPTEIQYDLPEWSIKAAINDSRFKPIISNEIPEIEISISLLVNFQRIENPFDWEIGKHGIDIFFNISSI